MGVVFPFSVLSPGQELAVTSGIDFLLPIEIGRQKKSVITHVVFHWLIRMIVSLMIVLVHELCCLCGEVLGLIVLGSARLDCFGKCSA